MILKNKFNFKLSLLISLGVLSLTNISAYCAPKMVPYTLIGSEESSTSRSSNSSPSAYRIYNSEYFADGTILYRQSHFDVTYYSPKPPEGAEEAKKGGESYKYVNWSFYQFKPNSRKEDWIREGTYFRSNEYYKEVELTQDAMAYGCTSDGQAKSTGTKLKKGTVLKVKSILVSLYKDSNGNPIEYVYFDTTGTGVSSFNKIARIDKKYTKKHSTEKTKILYFDELTDRNNTKCLKYYENFKKYKVDGRKLQGSSLETLSETTTTVPSNVTKCNLGGKTGEWRYLGVSSKGNAIFNPYFPSDAINYLGNGKLSYYDWRKTPWDYTDATKYERADSSGSKRDTLLKSDADSFIEQFDAPTYYDEYYKAEKVKIIQEMIDSSMAPANGDGQSTMTAQQWANCLSLVTDPYNETPIFTGQRRLGDYNQTFAYLTPLNDIYLSSFVVKNENGVVVASGTRSSYDKDFSYTTKQKLKNGCYYTVELKIGKRRNPAIKSSTLSSIVKIVNSKNASVTVYPKENDTSKTGLVTLSNKGGLVQNTNTSNVMKFGFKVPDTNTATSYTISGYVSPKHAGVDNLLYGNDSGSIKLPVDTTPDVSSGDIKAVSVKLLEGNTVVYDSTSSSKKTAIVPGKTYNIVYTAKYVGETLANKIFDGNSWVYDYNDIYKAKVPLNYTLTRKVGTTQSSDSTSKTGYFIDSNGNTSISMVKNTTMTFTIKNILFEHPYLDTSFTVTCTDKKVNKDTTNDTIKATLNDKFDIVIDNLTLTTLPSKEYVLENSSKEVVYNVTYDAKLTAPSYVRADQHKVLVDTSININGTQDRFVDLLEANTTTKNISHTVKGVLTDGTTGPYYCEVILNYNKAVYENGGYDNNRGITSISFEKVKNPTSGKSTDKAKNPYNGVNTSPDKGGDANNNCLIPRTKNSYSSTYDIFKWNATSKSYKSFEGNNKINFKTYTSSKTSKTVTNNESFIIKEVLFRSKDTKDKNLGAKKDGWVSMLDSNDSTIKAGYGFELKVIVEYKTDALINNPTESISSTSGTFVTNLASGINITPEIFVDLSGNERTILSSRKYSDSKIKQGLKVKQTKDNVLEGSMQVSEWEYTLKETTVNGVSSVGRIFIPENLKDGSYKLSIYTPPVSGVSSKAEYDKFKYSSLCDRKDTYITVKGSATDDLNSHNTQQSK